MSPTLQPAMPCGVTMHPRLPLEPLLTESRLFKIVSEATCLEIMVISHHLILVKCCFLTLLAACRFKSSEGVIVIAATNFPETLDKALVRPGRFDRHVTVLNPDVKGRQEILESHFKNVPRSSDVDLKARAG